MVNMSGEFNINSFQNSPSTMAADMIVSSISLQHDSSLRRLSASKKHEVLLKAATAMLSKVQASSQSVLRLIQV